MEEEDIFYDALDQLENDVIKDSWSDFDNKAIKNESVSEKNVNNNIYSLLKGWFAEKIDAMYDHIRVEAPNLGKAAEIVIQQMNDENNLKRIHELMINDKFKLSISQMKELFGIDTSFLKDNMGSLKDIIAKRTDKISFNYDWER